MTTLIWRDSRVEGLLEAASTAPRPESMWRAAKDAEAAADSAHYTIEQDSGFRPGRPDQAPGFHLSLIFVTGGDDVGALDLGLYRDLDAAKAAAERYEKTGSTASGGERKRRKKLRKLNRRVRFLPQDARNETARPGIEIGGVHVYAWFDERTGQLRVAVNYDTTNAAAIDEHGCVPTHVTVGGATVFEN